MEQDLGDRDYLFYQFNGVVVEEFVGSELRPIGIGQLIPQRLAVQFLTLAQALIETLVKHPHHLSKKNKKKKKKNQEDEYVGQSGPSISTAKPIRLNPIGTAAGSDRRWNGTERMAEVDHLFD